MKRVLVACIAAFAASSAGCGATPHNPHRLVDLDLATIPDLSGVPQPAKLNGARLVVIGRFDSTAPQPIGGLYDRYEYEVSPLYRTYFFKDGPVEIFEHVSDGLRAAGLAVLKDYAGHAEPALLDAPTREKKPVLVTATVSALQHDQVRESDQSTWEAGRVEVAVRVRETDGTDKYTRTYVVEGRIPYDGSTELLRLLGWRLAETLSRDPQFVAAVGAQPRG